MFFKYFSHNSTLNALQKNLLELWAPHTEKFEKPCASISLQQVLRQLQVLLAESLELKDIDKKVQTIQIMAQ